MSSSQSTESPTSEVATGDVQEDSGGIDTLSEDALLEAEFRILDTDKVLLGIVSSSLSLS